MDQCFDVKAASADNNYRFAARVNFSDRLHGHAAEPGCVHLLVNRQYSNEMMRHFLQCRPFRFGR